MCIQTPIPIAINHFFSIVKIHTINTITSPRTINFSYREGLKSEGGEIDPKYPEFCNPKP